MEINKRKKDNNRAARLYLKTLRLLIKLLLIKLKFITVTVCYILKYTFYMLIFRIDYDDYLKAINIIKAAYNLNFSKEFANYNISKDAMNEYFKIFM